MEQKQDASYARKTDIDTTFFDKYEATIFTYLRFHNITREDAEDLTLEVFIAAFEKNNLADIPESEHLAWLRRVAHNKLVDHYRRSQRYPTQRIEQPQVEIHEDTSPTPEELTLQQEEYQQVGAALKALPVEQQQILKLRFGAGLRFAEIGTLLDKREPTVRKIFSRTLHQLRTVYYQYQGEKA